MAWFPCNIGGGGSSEIANILKGTSDPVSSIGDNGQLYLKYGSDTRYTYDETLGGYVLNDYFYSEVNQPIGTVGGRVYSKNSNGAAIAVIWKNSSYSGPLLISTVESNITYSYNTSGSLGSATIDGVTWYLSTTNYWSNPVNDSVAPIIEADYYPTASSHLQEAIEDILEASDFKTSLSTTVVIDSFAKVNNAWQDLIGTDIDDIDYTGSGSAIEDYITDYFPCLLDSSYYTVFSKATNDEIYNGGRGGTRASSNPVFYFCCKTTDGFWGYGLIGLASASVQITATTSYGGATYYTQTTTNGNAVYLARLSSMNGGQASTVFKNGYLKIEIDGVQYIEQNVSTNLFDQTFVDAAYEALTALS